MKIFSCVNPGGEPFNKLHGGLIQNAKKEINELFLASQYFLERKTSFEKKRPLNKSLTPKRVHKPRGSGKVFTHPFFLFFLRFPTTHLYF
jgi:hypothetical protein